MTDVTILPVPRAHDGWTVDDLDLLPHDGLRYELLDGTLRVSPPAPNPHNVLATSLAARLGAALDRSWVVSAPGSVRIDERNRREPDVLVVRREGARSAHADPADVLLVVEVVSPSSVTDDRLVKPVQYAAAGIPFYWRVEPALPLLLTFAPDEGSYRETSRFDQQVAVEEPIPIRVDLRDLLV